MRYFLSGHCALKLLEEPSVFNTRTDELYELDEEAFDLLRASAAMEGTDAESGEFLDYCIKENILTNVPVNVRRPPLKNSPDPSLRYLELQITRRCNLMCRHCYLGPPVIDELGVREVRAILEEFELMQGLRVLITGGEPLMHSGFEEINRSLEGLAFRKVLFTNGIILTDDVLESLNVEEIQVSIDGLEEAHDCIRGNGSFIKAMDAIKRAISCGYQVSVSTMVHTRNLGDFGTMDRLFRDMGIKDWTVDVPSIAGRLEKNSTLCPSPEMAAAPLSYGFGEGLHEGSGGYSCGRHLMSVSADGNCAKCAFYENKPVGHFSQGLLRCWKKVKHIPLTDLDCNCDVIETCRGGCRFRAGKLGTPMGRDLYRCASYGKIIY
jgi:radical SAM protein with 4Fe4S-binding SPASM domain